MENKEYLPVHRLGLGEEAVRSAKVEQDRAF
jgi:hypothetical protein